MDLGEGKICFCCEEFQPAKCTDKENALKLFPVQPCSAVHLLLKVPRVGPTPTSKYTTEPSEKAKLLEISPLSYLPQTIALLKADRSQRSSVTQRQKWLQEEAWMTVCLLNDAWMAFFVSKNYKIAKNVKGSKYIHLCVYVFICMHIHSYWRTM